MINTTFESCEADVPGGKLALQGNVTLSSITGTCPNILVGDITAEVDLRMVYLDMEGTTQRSVAADLTATLSSRRGLDDPCFSTGVSGVVNGTIRTQYGEGGAAGGVDAELDDTGLIADVQTFSPNCVPLEDQQTFSGNVRFTDHPSGRVYDVDLMNYLVERTATAGGAESEMTGTASGPCFGGGAMVTTPAALQLPAAALCPTAGTVHLERAGNPPRNVVYGDGKVEVDIDGDGIADMMFPSCTSAPACGL